MQYRPRFVLLRRQRVSNEFFSDRLFVIYATDQILDPSVILPCESNHYLDINLCAAGMQTW